MGNSISRTSLGESFSAQYEISDVILGKGGFGVVKRCTHKDTKEIYAVKIVKPEDFPFKHTLHIFAEDSICPHLDHENVVRFYAGMFEGDFHYTVLEEIRGRYIFAEICDKNHYSERDARNYIQQILSAIQYCHERDIVHRDLRPTNILLRPSDDRIKLIDFDLAVIAIGDRKHRFGQDGTELYMAPEIMDNSPYGKPVDMWNCGILLYNLLTGNHPFARSDPADLRDSVLECDLKFLDTEETSSLIAIELVRNLICRDDNQRMTVAQALAHEFVTAIEKPSTAHKQKAIRCLTYIHEYLAGTSSDETNASRQ